MHLLPDLTKIIVDYGYLGIFVIVYLESGIFFALPGDSLLFTAGLMGSVYGMHLWLLIPIVFIATFFGGITGYYIGSKLDNLYRYKIFRKIIKKEHIEKTHEFFENHGRFTIILSRFVPIVRTFTPIVAGAAHMKKARFIKYSLISSILWASIVPILGYFLGRMFPWIKDYLFIFVVLIIIISLVPGIIKYISHRASKNR